MDAELLSDLARHQVWADAQHWTVLHSNAALRDDPSVRKRLNHMASACEMLQTLARGETPDFAAMRQERDSIEEIEAAMTSANQRLLAAIPSANLEKKYMMPRGPNGPFEAPAGMLLLQAITHSQHHRGQNAARMRELGITPPMTDFIYWYALGRP